MNNSEENLKHIQNVYHEKTIKYLKIAITLLALSCSTYLYFIFVYSAFDFGIILELISLVLLIISYNLCSSNKLSSFKNFIILSTLPIALLIFYDFINLLLHIKEVFAEVSLYYITMNKYFFILDPYIYDVILVLVLVYIYKSINSLKKLSNDNIQQTKDFTDTFYDSL